MAARRRSQRFYAVFFGLTCSPIQLSISASDIAGLLDAPESG
jgi:hypothetical protein